MNSPAQSVPSSNRPESFQIKGGLFPMNLLEVKTTDLGAIKQELAEKIQKAPEFFLNAPLVLGFEMLDEALQNEIHLSALVALCRSLKLLPAATRGGNEQLQQQALACGLATIAKGREKHMSAAADRPVRDSSAQAAPEPAPAEPEAAATRIVTTPIRSGQQIYAAGGDLIVLNSVSAGAEVLADGNIHIYGALRGRALAGIQGNEQARIFCTSQEAELVAIAGHFMVDENLRATHWKESVNIHIADGNIKILPLP